MVNQSKTLSENLVSKNWPPVCPVNLLNTNLSTGTKWAEYSGTYQQVINILDAQGIPESKVVGFIFTSAGRCSVIVHKH
jgi:hypothetical protein